MTSLITNAEFWKSLGSVLWPIATLIIFFGSKNVIKSVFSKESISIEVAGMKISVADAAKNIGKDLADIQQKVASIEQKIYGEKLVIDNSGSLEVSKNSSISTILYKPLSIIWVDDFPSNNAFLVDKLQREGINIELSLSTSDALEKIANRSYNAVISDLGRKEDGQQKPMAGLDLIKSLRGSGNNIPILIYAGSRGIENREILLKAGADIVTASGTEVVKFVSNVQANTQSKM